MDLRGPFNRRGAGEIALVLLLTTLILVGCGYYLLKFYFENSGIVPGVFFLGHDLGYLRQEKALSRIEQIVRSTYSKPIYLRHRERLWILRYGEHFKLSFDAGSILLDALEVGRKRSVQERIEHFLYLNYPRVDLTWKPSIDKDFSLPNIARTLKRVSRARIFAKRSLDPDTMELTILSGEMAVQQVIDALESSLQGDPLSEYRVVELAHLERGGVVKTVSITDPEHGFRHLLAENQTKYDVNDRPREANIQLALTHLEGCIINPGVVFSFNGTVGVRSEEAGFTQVPIVLRDKVERDIEAGVRQVATTLYKPVLLTGVRIVERHISDYYSPSLDYCQPGLEATVSSTNADFSFQNTLDFPMMITGTAEKGVLDIRLLGIQELSTKVEIRLGRLQKISYDTKIRKDDTLLRGIEEIEQIGIDGYAIKVFRTFYNKEGIKYREDMLYEKPDEYLARTSIVRIGTGSSASLPYVDENTHSLPRHSVSTEPGWLDPEALSPLGPEGY